MTTINRTLIPQVYSAQSDRWGLKWNSETGGFSIPESFEKKALKEAATQVKNSTEAQDIAARSTRIRNDIEASAQNQINFYKKMIFEKQKSIDALAAWGQSSGGSTAGVIAEAIESQQQELDGLKAQLIQSEYAFYNPS